MWHRHLLPVDRISCAARRSIRSDMGDNLVAEEIEIDPSV
jgi:hypothetical protein